MREYRVVQVKQSSMIKGRLTPKAFEGVLNENAAEGWIFDRTVSGETRLLGRDVFFVIFHREGG